MNATAAQSQAELSHAPAQHHAARDSIADDAAKTAHLAELHERCRAAFVRSRTLDRLDVALQKADTVNDILRAANVVYRFLYAPPLPVHAPAPQPPAPRKATSTGESAPRTHTPAPHAPHSSSSHAPAAEGGPSASEQAPIARHEATHAVAEPATHGASHANSSSTTSAPHEPAAPHIPSPTNTAALAPAPSSPAAPHAPFT